MTAEEERYYRALGLEPGATPDEIKEAYRDLVAVWHPDRLPANPRLQAKAEAKLKEINEAYEALQGQAAATVTARPAAAAARPAAAERPAPARPSPTRPTPRPVPSFRAPAATATAAPKARARRQSDPAPAAEWPAWAARLPMNEIMALLILLAVAFIIAVVVTAIQDLTTSPVPVAMIRALFH